MNALPNGLFSLFLHIRHQPHPRMAYGDGCIDTGDTCNNTCKITINKDV
jgi:hypothetical protein